MTWQLLPLLAIVSLVFGATRYEQPRAIFATFARTFLQVGVLFGVVLAALFVLSYRL